MERPVATHDVVISYATRDKTVATAICAALEARKIRCWIAPRDVEPGENYGSSIIHAIDAARIMVLVFSSAANASRPVASEVEHAAFNKASLKIIPFRIEDVAISSSLVLFLETVQWLDAVKKSRKTAIRELVELVSQLLPPQTIEDFLSPASFIRAAQAADPAFRFAILAAGVLAIVATFAKFGVGYTTLVFGSIALIGLMVLFLVFAQASKLSKSRLDKPAQVLVWSILVIAIAIILLLTGSVFFNHPLPLRDWIVEQLINNKMAADAQKQIANLKDQVDRGFEPLGNAITIRYTVMIPFAQEGLQGIQSQLQSQMRQLTSASPISSSGDTYVVHVSQPSQPERYLATFNNKSPLMPANEYQRDYLSQPPFGASLYLKSPPPLLPGGCGNLPPQADIEFAWDGASTSERTPDNFSDGVRWKGVTLSYSTTNNYLAQSAEGVFYIRSNNARIVKIVDLSQAYVRLVSRTQHKIEFRDLTVIIGQRSFALPQEQLVSDDCGVIIYRLPTIAPSN